MGKLSKAIVNNTYTFNINNTEAIALDTVCIDNHTQHILHENRCYTATLVKKDFIKKTYTITLNNTVYIVDFKDDLDILIETLGFSKGQKKQIKSILAPMPGLILDISVSEGQTVSENTPLLILEAMKMENSITAPIQGTIKTIHAKKGDAVEKNQLIIEFE